MNTQGSPTHIAAILKFGGVGGPRVTKWPRERGMGQGLGQKDGTRVKGQWGGVGPWGKGGARAWSWGILISPRNILRGIL